MQEQTTLASTPTQTLLRITTTYDVGDKRYESVRYEWWVCNAAMERGDYGGGGKVYCTSHAGKVDEVVLLERFWRETK